MRATDFDHTVALLARRQHGVVSRRQVLDAGGTDRAIAGRLRNGRWIRLDPGVYALSSSPSTWHRALMAAQLSEPVAGIAGRAAAAFHAFAGFRPVRPEIAVPPRSNPSSRLAIVHELAATDLTVVQGIRVLTPVDTLLHVAGLVPPARTRIAFDHLLATRALRAEDVARRFHQLEQGRRPGNPLMRELLLDRLDEAYEPPASVLESLLYEVLDGPGMPRYVRQHQIDASRDDGWVDAMIPSSRLIVEGDGRTWHTRLADFARDRERDRRAAVRGYRTLRFTWHDLRDNPAAARRDILDAHRWAAAA